MSRNVHIDDKVVRGIEILNIIVRHLIWKTSKQVRLSPIQIHFILFLRKKPEKFRKITFLSSEFHLTPATVSNAINSLIKKGIIARKNDPYDRRVYYLYLTERGRKIANTLAQWNKSLKAVVSRLNYEDKRSFFKFFLRLIQSLFKDGAIDQVRICPLCGHLVKLAPKKAGNKIFKCLLTGKYMTLEKVELDCSFYIPHSIKK